MERSRAHNYKCSGNYSIVLDEYPFTNICFSLTVILGEMGAETDFGVLGRVSQMWNEEQEWWGKKRRDR